MLPFYQGLTAIFVTFFASISPVWANEYPPVFDVDCQYMLGDTLETKSVKIVKQSPSRTYSIFYKRFIESLGTNEPGNFRVDDLDLFTEDIIVIKSRLEYAKKYFETIGKKNYLEAAVGLLTRAEQMLTQRYGYLEYFTFGEFSSCVTDVVLSLRYAQREDIPGYPKLLERPVNFFWQREAEGLLESVQQQLSKNVRISEESNAAIFSYYGFPLFALPTVSDTSRLDMVWMSSAPFWIKKWPGHVGPIDNKPEVQSPSNISYHDNQHGAAAAILAEIAPDRFKDNWDLFFGFIVRKERVTRYILNRLKEITDPIAHLRMDQMLFSVVHEAGNGSIEFFSANYWKLFFKFDAQNRPDYTEEKHRHRYNAVNAVALHFLGDKEQKLLEQARAGKPYEITISEYEVLSQQIAKWYIEGGGPEYRGPVLRPPPKPRPPSQGVIRLFLNRFFD